MVHVAHPGGAPGPVTITQSRTSWGLEIGRHRVSVTRLREARSVGGTGDGTGGGAGAQPSRPAARSVWPLAIGVFVSVSAFGLFVVGAIASEPSIAHHPSRYSLILPIPTQVVKFVRASPPRDARKAQPASALDAAPAWAGDLSGPRFDVADEPYVVRAMQAGDFQEWLGSDGQRRFLNAGPEQADGDRRCRDLALLVRHPDGSSRTRTARRCALLPASEGPASEGPASGRTALATPVSHAPETTDPSPVESDAPAVAASVVDPVEGDRGMAAGR